jgi:hypothetical protein
MYIGNLGRDSWEYSWPKILCIESIWGGDLIEKIIEYIFLPIFSESTAPWLGTASWTDVAFYLMPGAGHHYQSDTICTGTQ